jgi:uncharacterized protein (DUF2062 family)
MPQDIHKSHKGTILIASASACFLLYPLFIQIFYIIFRLEHEWLYNPYYPAAIFSFIFCAGIFTKFSGPFLERLIGSTILGLIFCLLLYALSIFVFIISGTFFALKGIPGFDLM